MFRAFLSALLICFLFVRQLSAQHIYYKSPDKAVLGGFKDSLNKLTFVNSDSVDYADHFKYVLKFFPTMQYENIKIIFKPSKKVARVKPTFMCFFQSPDKRKYRIYFSNKINSPLDSVTLKNLKLNEQLGLIARQIGHIHDLSTDGFFDLLGWRLKQSTKGKSKLEHENELKILELGLGYQLLSLSKAEEQKLMIEKWSSAKSHSKYQKKNRNRFMGPQTISNFIADMPVYVSHKYR